MSVTTPKQVFVALLSNLKQSNEKAASIYTEIGQAVHDPEIKEALEARAFLSEKTVATLNQCFKVIGEQPVKFSGRIQETFVEDFRKELAEIQSPIAKKLFVLAKLTHLTTPPHRRIQGPYWNGRRCWPSWSRSHAGELSRRQDRLRGAHALPRPAHGRGEDRRTRSLKARRNWQLPKRLHRHRLP